MRFKFGGDMPAYVVIPKDIDNGDLTVLFDAGRPIAAFNNGTNTDAASQYTDLLDSTGIEVSTVDAGPTGGIPEFSGPDGDPLGPGYLWLRSVLDDGSYGPAVKLAANNLADVINELYGTTADLQSQVDLIESSGVASVDGRTGTVSLDDVYVGKGPIDNPAEAGTLRIGTFAEDTVTNVADIRSDDPTVGGVFIKHRPTTPTGNHALTTYQAGPGGTGSALNAVSDNPEASCVQVSGSEVDKGTIKIAHHGQADGSDGSASAISIDLQTAGTAAQGIFITATNGPTSGNPLTVRNNPREDLVLKADGRLGVGIPTGATPAGRVEVDQIDNTTPGLVLKAASSSSQSLLEARDSTGAVKTNIDRIGNVVCREISFLVKGVQVGAASAGFGGTLGVIGMTNVTSAPNPASAPVNGGVLYVEGGALKYLGSAGTVTQLAAA